MIIDLERYRSPMPYPTVGKAKPDKKLAATLLDGYSGETSEMTTVLQYAYHSLRCKKNFEEISQTMRGIFYVETLHMELLGDCVQKMGIDPRYAVRLREKAVDWQASLISYCPTPAKMLLADLEGEKEAVRFYEETAATTGQPEIAALLWRLAEDEKLHVRILTDLYRRTFGR